MKTIATLAILTAGITSSHADLTFSAPGTASVHGTGLNYSVDHSVKNQDGQNYQKYRITGYSYQLNAGRLSNTAFNKGFGTANSVRGLLMDANGNPTTGNITAQVIVKSGGTNKWAMPELTFTASHKDDIKEGSVTLSTPVEIKESNIDLGFSYVTDMLTSGDSITIHGEAINLLPEPTGSLNLAKNTALLDREFSEEGYYPPLNWRISKITGSTSASGTTTGTTTGGTTTTTTESSSEAEDADNIGLAKSNNGHGNNLDGIDVSNPGKSAAKWAEKGMFDTDYNRDGSFEDDEASGGGAAPSQ